MKVLEVIVSHRGLALPIAIVACIGILLVPLPAAIMDLLLSANIAISLVLLLTTLNIKNPLQLSVFPSLLVATTLSRLVLNVGTTRLILTQASSDGDQAAGGVIAAFGNFVAGDMLIVGVVIFAIIVAIQLLVITKGATRIGEVAARFALDGMPGKQMAIDADLNNGSINEEQARQRRESLAEEADFYGAMDGASKFVRGDAIAAILITAINIVGGLAVGLSTGMGLERSVDVFTRLTIGDGLASQIPAFLISVAAALLVTRSHRDVDLPNEFLSQLTSQPQTLAVAGVFLGLLVFTNLPALPLLALATAFMGLAITLRRKEVAESQAQAEREKLASRQAAPPAPSPEQMLGVDPIRISIGAQLLALADPGRGGALLPRVTSVRTKMAADMGFLVPKVRLKDDFSLPPTAYEISLFGDVVAEGTVYPDRQMCRATAGSAAAPGIEDLDPISGQPVVWIEDPDVERLADAAERRSPIDVMADHLETVVRVHADELLTREQTKALVDQVRQTSPAVVDELIPSVLRLAQVQRVLQILVSEDIPIRQLDIILETLADCASRTQHPYLLAQFVRDRLARTICRKFCDFPHRLTTFALAPELEDRIADHIELADEQVQLNLPATELDQLCAEIESCISQSAPMASPKLLVRPVCRAALSVALRKRFPRLVVLSHSEMTLQVEIQRLATFGAIRAVA